MSASPHAGLHGPGRLEVEPLPVTSPGHQANGRRRIGESERQERFAPVSVGVIVDLFQDASAGGHVKCWEKPVPMRPAWSFSTPPRFRMILAKLPAYREADRVYKEIQTHYPGNGVLLQTLQPA